ncbi:MAG: hypothetical protein Q9159_003388 [Coniocarpon cinnabarinum]
MQPIAAVILALATLPFHTHASEGTTLTTKDWISTQTETYHKTTAGEPYRDYTTGPVATMTTTMRYEEEDYSYPAEVLTWTRTESKDGKAHATIYTSTIGGTVEQANKMHLPSLFLPLAVLTLQAQTQVQAQTSFLTTKNWLSTKTNTYQPKTKGQAYGTGPFTTATRTERIYEMDYSEPAKVYSWSRTQTISGKLTSETRKTTFGGSLEKLYHISEA